jgi:hypothetical protein
MYSFIRKASWLLSSAGDIHGDILADLLGRNCLPLSGDEGFKAAFQQIAAGRTDSVRSSGPPIPPTCRGDHGKSAANSVIKTVVAGVGCRLDPRPFSAAASSAQRS